MEVAPPTILRPRKNHTIFAIPSRLPPKKMPRSSERIPMRVPVVLGFAGKSGASRRTETSNRQFQRRAVTLKAKTREGDTVFLIHKSARQEQEVRVVSRRILRPRNYAVEFRFQTTRLWLLEKTRKKPAFRRTFAYIVKARTQGPSFAKRLHRRYQRGWRAVTASAF